MNKTEILRAWAEGKHIKYLSLSPSRISFAFLFYIYLSQMSARLLSISPSISRIRKHKKEFDEIFMSVLLLLFGFYRRTSRNCGIQSTRMTWRWCLLRLWYGVENWSWKAQITIGIFKMIEWQKLLLSCQRSDWLSSNCNTFIQNAFKLCETKTWKIILIN